ncbi:unnamed protein product [Leptosia nina]|uniref:Uncharacterized protein n=1 Tax=Leptosia nina TaxID=320188 RepID=A0AAV1JX01_9NEOP
MYNIMGRFVPAVGTVKELDDVQWAHLYKAGCIIDKRNNELIQREILNGTQNLRGRQKGYTKMLKLHMSVKHLVGFCF